MQLKLKTQKTMTNNDMTGLLNLAYEIEGLLMLHINRGDEASPEMKNLLIAKAGDLLDGLKSADGTRPEASQECGAPHEEPVAEVAMAVAADTVEATEEADAQAIAANALEEERSDADVAPTVNDTLGADPQLTLDEKLARERAADISKAFTINDRFRFRRELFRNSDEEFKETLEVIGSMSGMDEAEDYFFNDLCWDASNPEVKEFMDIVARHF